MTYEQVFYLEGQGLNYLEYYALDYLGNEGDVQNQTHYVDDTPPTTTKKIGNPNLKDGLWVTSETMFSMSADDLDGVGILGTFYRSWYNDSWNDWVKYTGEFNFSGDGNHTLEFYSMDELGNMETFQSQYHKVDNTPPEMTEEVGEPNWEDGYQVSKDTIIWFNATDLDPGGGNGSMVEYIYYEIWWDSDDDGEVDSMEENDTFYAHYVELYLKDFGLNRIIYHAVDFLGNTSVQDFREHELV